MFISILISTHLVKMSLFDWIVLEKCQKQNKGRQIDSYDFFIFKMMMALPFKKCYLI